jgi:hypothetical protein
MATSYSPKIITDGLVLCLDAADKKSLLAPPTTNLANNSNGTINWTTADLGATVRTQSTVDANSYHYRFVLDKGSDNNAQLRFAFDHTNLTNGETYIMSYKYKITSGSGSFYITDFCDQSVTRVTTDIGDGWYYETAYGTRSSYTETHDFFDTLATENMTVDVKEIQVEHTSASSPLATPFVSYQRQWKDRAGSNNGTFVNMNDQSDFSSEGGGSLIFEGSNSYVNLGDPDVLNPETGNFTLSFVTYRTGTGYQGGGYVGKGNGTSQGFDFRDGSFYVHGASGLIASMSFTSSVNSWQHHTLVFDRTSSPYITRYTNGIFNSSSNTNNSANASSSIDTSIDFRVGLSNAGGVNRYFIGKIPTVSMYSKALTAEEVLQNYNATKGRFGL